MRRFTLRNAASAGSTVRDVDADRVRGGQRGQRVHHVVAAEQRPAHVADLAGRVRARRSALPSSRAAARARPVAARLRSRISRSVSTGVQQPIASTSARCASSPLTISRPRRGTVRTRWWNWRWIAARSGKMSAWSNSRLLRIATAAGSARTCCACRRTRCRIRRPRPRTRGPLPSARRDAEILGDAADQEARLAPGRLEQPGEDRGGRGLAVRAGDGERVAARQHVFGTATARRRCSGGRRRAPARPPDCRATARCRRRSRRSRRRCCRARSPGAARCRAARAASTSADRRLVAAVDVVPEFARQRGDAAHEGAGDAEDVDLQDRCVLARSDWHGACDAARSVRQPTSRTGAIASRMRVNTSSSVPTPSTTVSWPCWR